MFLFYKDKQGSLEITQTYGHKYMTDSISTVGCGGQHVRQKSTRLQRQTTSIQAPSLTTYRRNKKSYSPIQQGFKSTCHLPATVVGLRTYSAPVLLSRSFRSCQGVVCGWKEGVRYRQTTRVTEHIHVNVCAGICESWLETKGRLGVGDRRGWLGAPEMEQVRGFKQESDVMYLVWRDYLATSQEQTERTHSGKRETGQAATQVSPESNFSTMRRGGGHPTEQCPPKISMRSKQD